MPGHSKTVCWRTASWTFVYLLGFALVLRALVGA
ncbi:hypothetical protein MNBD_ALPHA12-999 [hydrothermal vent metagenome]|uniref:Uncharacterized protein n=1 Tax=hydrothermal vent metagenome TaxID=652676 RepID=A0A3B0TP85_9ZZZZ